MSHLYTYQTGGMVVQEKNKQLVLINPHYSLKRVSMFLPISAKLIQRKCARFAETVMEGWEAWLNSILRRPVRAKQDLVAKVFGGVGTGLGVMNAMDAKQLADKINHTGQNMASLSQPLITSLTQLSTFDYQLSHILPQWYTMQAMDNEALLEVIATL